MILGLEFPPISHVVEWPTLFGSGPFAVNKVVILMWVSAVIAFTVMYLGGRKQALVPTGMQNLAESAVGFIEDGIVMETMGPDGLKYTPFLLTLFTFVLTCNIWGLIPGVQMPVNARIALPVFLAILVWAHLPRHRHRLAGPDQVLQVGHHPARRAQGDPAARVPHRAARRSSSPGRSRWPSGSSPT